MSSQDGFSAFRTTVCFSVEGGSKSKYQCVSTLAKDMATPGYLEDIKRMEKEIYQFRYDIEMKNGKRLTEAETKQQINSIVKAINLISQEMKPQMISYCKSYMGWKSRHKRELLLEGRIRYIRYSEYNEK